MPFEPNDRPACERPGCHGRKATLTVRAIGGRLVPVCTRCAGSMILDIGGAHGALVKPLTGVARRARDRAGQFVPRALGRRGVR